MRAPVRVAVVAALVLAGPTWPIGAATMDDVASGREPLTIADPGDRSSTTRHAGSHDQKERHRGGRASRDGERVTSGLEVTISQLSPASLAPDTPLYVSGTVTNLDPHEWIDLTAYLVVDDVAITSPEQLEGVLASPADTFSGERICCDERFFDAIPTSLAPGESTTYTLNVPFGQLGLAGAPSGVYTVSVHVLGQRVDQPRNESGTPEADGRARVLMPYLSEADAPTPLAVVIPFRHDLRRLPDGTFQDVEELVESISAGGLLRNRLELIAASESGQATVLIDPALLDALRAIADDDFGPPGERDDGGEAEADPTEAQQAAVYFLERLELAAGRSSVLVEPYARADLTALAQNPDLELGRTVRKVGARALEAGSISGTTVYQPEDVLDPEALETIGRHRTVLVGSQQVQGWSRSGGPAARLVADNVSAPVLVADTSLVLGGLAPGPSDSALHVRQRVLAESAVLSLAGQEAGLVFMPDEDWDPGPGPVGDQLFDELDTAWVRSTSLAAMVGSGRPPRVVAQEALAPEPLPTSVLKDAARLRRRATTLEALTGQEGALPYYLQNTAFALSSTWRDAPGRAAELAAENVEAIDQQLSRLSIQGPQAVTLSSNSGSFPVTLTNRLDIPVTVGARIYDAENLLEVARIEAQEIAPDSQETITIDVEAPDVGTTTVYARLVTEGGRQFGEPISFPLRSSVIGEVIWYVMGAAGIFVLLLIVRRRGRGLRPTAAEPGRVP